MSSERKREAETCSLKNNKVKSEDFSFPHTLNLSSGQRGSSRPLIPAGHLVHQLPPPFHPRGPGCPIFSGGLRRHVQAGFLPPAGFVFLWQISWKASLIVPHQAADGFLPFNTPTLHPGLEPSAPRPFA